MFDLPKSSALADKLMKIWKRGGALGAVCHGPVGLTQMKDPETGEHFLKDRKVTGFSNSEEKSVGKDITTGTRQTIPFLLEDKLREIVRIHIHT